MIDQLSRKEKILFFKGIFFSLRKDLIENGWENRNLNWDEHFTTISKALNDPAYSKIVKRLLPEIRARKYCPTVGMRANNTIAKWLCQKLFGRVNVKHSTTYKKYRLLRVTK